MLFSVLVSCTWTYYSKPSRDNLACIIKVSWTKTWPKAGKIHLGAVFKIIFLSGWLGPSVPVKAEAINLALPQS